MNKTRRKQLAEIAEQLESLKGSIELLQEEEQDAFDNLPESLQQGEKGEAMEQAIENMGSAVEWIDETLSAIGEASA